MPRFKVVQFRDAVVRYEVEIEAANAQAALDIAKQQDCAWIGCGTGTYDSADMEVQDLEGKELIASHPVW